MYKGYKFRFSSDTCLAAPRASLQMATSQKKKNATWDSKWKSGGVDGMLLLLQSFCL